MEFRCRISLRANHNRAYFGPPATQRPRRGFRHKPWHFDSRFLGGPPRPPWARRPDCRGAGYLRQLHRRRRLKDRKRRSESHKRKHAVRFFARGLGNVAILGYQRRITHVEDTLCTVRRACPPVRWEHFRLQYCCCVKSIRKKSACNSRHYSERVVRGTCELHHYLD